MIRAIIFDLDGTLVQTEKLKALSYTIATPFTTAGLHSSQIIEDAWIVHEPEKLAEMVRRRIEEHNRTAHQDRRVREKGGA